MQSTPARRADALSCLSGTWLPGRAILVVAGLAICLPVDAAQCEETPKTDGVPNIVFIIADDD